MSSWVSSLHRDVLIERSFMLQKKPVTSTEVLNKLGFVSIYL